MGQFDSPSEGALSRLKSESLSASVVDNPASSLASIGAKILELAAFTGISTLTDLLLTLKSIAAGKDEANLIYFGEALVDDFRRLYRLNEETRRILKDQLSSKEFDQAVANATLHIVRTNVEVRLKRLANLLANGVKSQDLEPESLDDMMRAAVELKDRDIELLKKLYKSQVGLLTSQQALSSDWSQQVAASWANNFSFLDASNSRDARSSLMRLQSVGLVQEVRTMMTPTGRAAAQPFGLLPDGMKFYERLQEIATSEGIT
ncbi:hypothetical protein [Terracidiphilus sp.]|jgi:DNA-directed RNA polymerase subunit F|uniref:hypothetical protein n=1 Tax=Terracidiphilus sp. TaxID=1964191 RepID=UPI003C25A33C